MNFVNMLEGAVYSDFLEIFLKKPLFSNKLKQ
jgi:hypothetical protein